ncbi:hypothetical protein [Micrococcus sp. TA1]|uniref:hypothetical protein n=1 Tax=Micrococcus sp. TA1 TaxID=681627 RepID=UPI00160AC472|nr:hypothetical protein [Micrococcus sp. TA1]MBB5748549.1 hypothetical protein [Micrococcus sp. TA1]
MNIPGDLIEKAAKAVHQYDDPGKDWQGNLTADERDMYRDAACAALVAVMPYLKEQS